MKNIKLCHIYPDLLDLYGDRGNITVLRRRLEWRGYAAECVSSAMGEALPPDCEVYMIGDGSGLENDRLYADFFEKKAPVLRRAAEDGRVILGIGAGFELMCRERRLADGSVKSGLGLVGGYAAEGGDREAGELIFEFNGVPCAGFESHGDRVYLDDGVAPLGRVSFGGGNNGSDGGEGARVGNIFCSFSHGPLLAKNPELADAILSAAVGEVLSPLDDGAENRARDYVLSRHEMSYPHHEVQ